MREYVCAELNRSFPNLGPRKIHDFVMGLFDLNMDLTAYKTHLRDFLVQSKVPLLPGWL